MKISQMLVEKDAWDVKSVSPFASLRETAATLLQYKVGALVVTNLNNKMLGIVSERDLVPVVASDDSESSLTPVSEVMTKSVITCGPEDEIAFVLRLMNDHGIRHMPVLEQGELLGVLSIRELTKAYELLQIEANTDPLTQVSNRRPFLKTLDREFDRARRFEHPISVAMLDIDHFKQVNDSYGHDGGDRALQAMSRLLIGEFRTIDLVGRLGGEEFALVFPETNLVGAKIACERLRKSIQQAQICSDNPSLSITVSIGIAEATEGSPDGPSLLKRADELLYLAKRTGRNRTVCDGDDYTVEAEAATG